MSSSEEERTTCWHCLWESSEEDQAAEAKKHSIIDAVKQNDISTLRMLLDSPELYTIQDEFGCTLLQIAILQAVEDDAFEYLLSLEDYPFDAANYRGETALVTALCNTVRRILFNGDCFARQLIEKGANIHKICSHGDSLLHCAFQKKYVDVATLLVEKGVDINQVNKEGDTPLHVCCMCCSDEELVEGVSMLLCHGADPWIRNQKGHTAFDYVITKGSNHDVAVAAESLYYYLFDDFTQYDIDAEILLEAATVQLPFFKQVMEHIGKVIIQDTIKYHCSDLFIMEPKYLQVFIEKFDYVIMELLKTSKNTAFYYSRAISAENFYVLVESKLQSEFIDWLCNVNICGVIGNFVKYRKPEVALRELFCFLLSYGTTVTTEDLHLIFEEYGYCQLFKILLHMDVIEIYFECIKDVMPRLLYYVTTDVQEIVEDPLTLTAREWSQILSYYALPKLKNICSDLQIDSDIMEKLYNQPEIPLLVEMARNVFRKYFMQKLNITTARQFYTQLQLLPVSPHHKKIIALEAKLY